MSLVIYSLDKGHLLRRVLVRGETECWPFRGAVTGRGYGNFLFEGKQYPAHNLIFQAAKRKLKPGEIVRHMCNNEKCCNPAHLEAGSCSDNSQDAVRSGSYTPGVSGITGVRYDASRKRWIASARYLQERYNLYQGRDFFEACCARKAWDARFLLGWRPK